MSQSLFSINMTTVLLLAYYPSLKPDPELFEMLN